MRGSPSRSLCSRGSRRSRRATAQSSSAGRSRGSRARIALEARSCSSRCSSARRASTASAARAPGKTARRPPGGARRLVAADGRPRHDVPQPRRTRLLRRRDPRDVSRCCALAERFGRVDRSLVPDFVLPLVPIAAAYLMAHYFTLFLTQGQFIITLASDPFGRGWDLFGTADFAPNLASSRPRRCGTCRSAYSWSATLRALRSRTTVRSRCSRAGRTALEAQLPMLGLMVLYTLGGMWLLTRA